MNIINKKFIFFSLSAILLSVSLIVYAEWKEPNVNLPDEINSIDLPAVLNVSSRNQAKLGGLEVNRNGAELGIHITGQTNSGFFGIGTNTPAEKVDVIGNIGFTDFVFVNNNKGKVAERKGNKSGEILTRIDVIGNEPQMDWKPRKAWMTVHRVDIVAKDKPCIKIFPKCPDRWTESEVITVSEECLKYTTKQGPPLLYGGKLRICYKDF